MPQTTLSVAWACCGRRGSPLFLLCPSPREPDNSEFGTKLGRQKTGRKPNLLKTTKFFEFTGTNAFSRIQSRLSWGTGFAQKPSVFRLTRISRVGQFSIRFWVRNPNRNRFPQTDSDSDSDPDPVFNPSRTWKPALDSARKHRTAGCAGSGRRCQRRRRRRRRMPSLSTTMAWRWKRARTRP